MNSVLEYTILGFTFIGLPIQFINIILIRNNKNLKIFSKYAFKKQLNMPKRNLKNIYSVVLKNMY